MFDPNSRYMTRRIQEELPVEILLLLWYEIDGQKNAGLEMDYLHVFSFEKLGDDTFVIKHEQEQPARITYSYCNYYAEYESLLAKKVFIIDDGDHSTELGAEEY